MIKKLLIPIITLLILFTLTELTFTLLNIEPPIPQNQYEYIKHSTNNPFLIFGPNTRTIQHKTPAIWNKQGLRINHTLSSNHTEIRIIALGGSTTENLANSENLHYPGISDTLLQHKNIRIYNGAKSAYSTTHTLIRIQTDILPLKPQIITIMHNLNDLTVNYFPTTENNHYNYGNKYFQQPYKQTYNIKSTQLNRIRTIRYFYKKWQQIKLKTKSTNIKTDQGNIQTTMQYKTYTNELPSLQTFKNNLKSIISICNTHNITCLLITQPALNTKPMVSLHMGTKEYNHIIKYPYLPQFQQQFKTYNQAIRNISNQTQTPLLDLERLIPQEQQYFRDHVHYTPEGLHLVALHYTKKIEELIQWDS